MRKIVHSILGIESEPSIDANLRKSCKSNRELVQDQGSRLTSAERVDFVFRHVAVRLSDGGRSGRKLRKNSTVARQLRERGNTFYKQKEFSDALDCYNVAIMFAPSGDQELGLAYANRSIVLLKLGHPEEALSDVDLALVNNYPKPPVLESRRKKCSEMIDQRNEIRDDEEQEFRVKMEEEMRKRREMYEEMMRIEKPNPRIPEAAEFVTIEYDQVMGRRLCVSRDVPAGTVLTVTKPYVTAFRREENYGWNSEYCHYCLKRIRRGIPCDRCVFTIYCTESCKTKAQDEYHKYECPCMDLAHFQESAGTLAFRTVCKAGPKKLFELYQSQDTAFFNPKEPYGVAEDCTFNEDPYLAVYHMKTHSEKLYEPEEANVWRTFCAVLFASDLESRSTFFDDISNGKMTKSRRTDFKKFVASLIRHHIDSVKVNPTPVTETSGLEGISLADFYSGEIDLKELMLKTQSSRNFAFATGMYPLDSLNNHSCVPNIYFVDDVSKGRKATIAAVDLKAGDVLYAFYEFNFMQKPLKYRQEYLRRKFHFTCKCVACVYDWPTEEEALRGGFAMVPHFCCPDCSVKYSTAEKASTDFRNKCGLTDAGGWKCGSCGKQYSKDALQLQFAEKIKVVNEGNILRMSWRQREAIPKLFEGVKFFQTYLCPPFHFQVGIERSCCNALTLLVHSIKG